MKQAFQYKLLPNTNQRSRIERWLSMLRYQYNYLLDDRFNWWQYNRSECVIPQGKFCQISCTVGSLILRDNPDWHSQSASLPKLKTERPWYKSIYSQVLQDCVKRVKLAFDRYIKGDSKGKRSGKPRFKGRNRYRTFTFSQAKLANLQRKLADNNRSRKAKKLIRRAMRALHLKIARQRKQWHFEEAKKLCQKADVICIEDLKIANLRRKNKAKKIDGRYVENGQCRKSGLNKSFSDCAMAQFVDILHFSAKKLGVKILKTNPRNTSQTCPVCLNKVSKTLSDRWHECPRVIASNK